MSAVMFNRPPPRVLHVITGLNTGGAERSLVNLLLSGNVDLQIPHVISLAGHGSYGPLLAANGIGMDWLEIDGPIGLASNLKRIRSIVKKFQPDLIQGWMYHGNLVASIAGIFATAGTPVVWNIRQSLYDFPSEKVGTQRVIQLLAMLSSQPQAILFNSHLSLAHHEAFGFSISKATVIANGFDPQRWRPCAIKRHQVRNQLKVQGDDIVLGFVGRHHPMKDLPTFLSGCAVALVADTRINVVLVGEGLTKDNSALAPYLAALPASRVHFLGRRDDIDTIMPGFDLFCISSRSEAFPNVLGEAMATGIPCIATDVGDCAKLLGDQGIIVPPGNPAKLADAILTLAHLKFSDREDIGKALRTRIVSSFSLEATIGQYMRLYNELTKREN